MAHGRLTLILLRNDKIDVMVISATHRTQCVVMKLFAFFTATHRSAAVFQMRSTQAPTTYFQVLGGSNFVTDSPVLVASVAVMVPEAKSACGP